jgi:signal transduction histidine kinase
MEVLANRIQQGAVLLAGDGTVLFANERFSSDMLKLPAVEVVGKPLLDFVADEDRDAASATLAAGRISRSKCEVHLALASGARPSVLMAAYAVDADQTLCLLEDLSLQKRHAAADERTRKFLGMLAHEFRGMLATIGYSAAYLKAAGALDPKAREAVDTIERQTQRLSALVEDLRSVNPKD